MSQLFYLRYNSDGQVVLQYNLPPAYQQVTDFELFNLLKSYLSPILGKQKKLTDEVKLATPLQQRQNLPAQNTTYMSLIEQINSFSSSVKQLNHLQKSNQQYQIDEVVNFFRVLPNQYVNLFQPKVYYLAEQKIYPFSYLSLNHLVDYIVQLSLEPYRVLLACYRLNGQKQYLVIGGKFNDREFDTLIPFLFEREIADLNIESIDTAATEINFIADTYFGEFYTEKRKKKGVEDALTKYGYGHSFAQLAPLFKPDSFNVVNFEAVFHQHIDSPLIGQKDFILGADAQQTIQQLEQLHFDVVAVANNHALDYGTSSFLYTCEQFKQAKMIVLGGGQDQYAANKILEIKHSTGKIAIFNGYWNKVNAYVDYEFYALADRPGINILNGVLLEQIELYKQQNPDSLVICFCHWGLDFKPVHAYQRSLSKRMINAGADLILGHGPHTLQDVEIIQDQHVIYSMGNGVFNSNGEFDRHQALPYGVVTRLDLSAQQVRLYPFLANNLKTFWQPRLVKEIEFEEIKAFYQNAEWLQPVQDEVGFHFSFNIKI